MIRFWGRIISVVLIVFAIALLEYSWHHHVDILEDVSNAIVLFVCIFMDDFITLVYKIRYRIRKKKTINTKNGVKK